MFDLEDFHKSIRNEYSSEITFDHAIYLQEIIDSFNCDYCTILKYTGANSLHAQLSHHHSFYIPVFKYVLLEGCRRFSYIYAKDINTNNQFIVYFYKSKLLFVHENIYKISKLKAFL